jgi:hypothetical protein
VTRQNFTPPASSLLRKQEEDLANIHQQWGEKKKEKQGNAVCALETRLLIPTFTLYTAEFAGQRSRCSDRLRAGRSRDRIAVWSRFFVPVHIGTEVHADPCKMGTGSFPEVTRPGCNADHPPSSNAELTNRLELYLCVTPMPAQACHGVTFTFRGICNK